MDDSEPIDLIQQSCFVWGPVARRACGSAKRIASSAGRGVDVPGSFTDSGASTQVA